MFDTTEKLTRGMAAGDGKAIEWFYRRYFDWLLAEAVRASRRDEAFCLDVVQEAVLRIVRTVRCVQSEAQFRTWLRLVVQTCAYDAIRAEMRRQKREAMAVKPSASVEASDGADGEQLRWLEGQIQRLDPELGRIMEMRFKQGWKLRRIAEKLGISVGTVDGRLRRAIIDLRRRAEETFDECEP
ncbi:MAG TPA: sigma-70 family RNA polymerase sigma factor [Tepidisphaeraceae bacterium]|nr:sigma-70 family RNA polymerase sigma factor [Tepidisphaeraceae bacterium]